MANASNVTATTVVLSDDESMRSVSAILTGAEGRIARMAAEHLFTLLGDATGGKRWVEHVRKADPILQSMLRDPNTHEYAPMRLQELIGQWLHDHVDVKSMKSMHRKVERMQVELTTAQQQLQNAFTFISQSPMRAPPPEVPNAPVDRSELAEAKSRIASLEQALGAARTSAEEYKVAAMRLRERSEACLKLMSFEETKYQNADKAVDALRQSNAALRGEIDALLAGGPHSREVKAMEAAGELRGQVEHWQAVAAERAKLLVECEKRMGDLDQEIAQSRRDHAAITAQNEAEAESWRAALVERDALVGQLEAQLEHSNAGWTADKDQLNRLRRSLHEIRQTESSRNQAAQAALQLRNSNLALRVATFRRVISRMQRDSIDAARRAQQQQLVLTEAVARSQLWADALIGTHDTAVEASRRLYAASSDAMARVLQKVLLTTDAATPRPRAAAPKADTSMSFERTPSALRGRSVHPTA